MVGWHLGVGGRHLTWGAVIGAGDSWAKPRKAVGRGWQGDMGYRKSVQVEGTAWKTSPISRGMPDTPTRDHPLSRGTSSIKAMP